MGVRLFDWRDLPGLQHYRKDGVFLDSALLLTRGSLLVPGILLSSLAPSMGIFTCILEQGSKDEPHVMGQCIHPAGSPLSHLTYLAPDGEFENGVVCTLVEFMMALSGDRGALRMVADVEEDTITFESLRRCGFAIYNRQRIWRLTNQREKFPELGKWRSAADRDSIPARNLYSNLVPGLVQQIEPFTHHPRGMVYYQDGDLLAYVELKYGHRGIWAQPFIHPDAEDVADHLGELFNKISGRRHRPIYICIRSHQSWLESAIEKLGGSASPRQAVMARQLAIPQKAARAYAIPVLESGQPEVTAPLAHIER